MKKEQQKNGAAAQKAPLTAVEYKNMIASAAVPFAVIEVLFLAFAVYLFVSFPKTPLYGGIFLGIAAVFAGVCITVLCVLRAKYRHAARREGPAPQQMAPRKRK